MEQTSKTYPLQFTGTGGEYFGIWIVNITLTLITLGIYSAWAKVRRNRWFYGHTLLDDQAFSYLASPLQILKGRLIAAAALIAYSLVHAISPTLGALVLLGLLAVTPWIVVSSLRFRARMTAYRGLRFDFTGKTGEAFVIYLLLPILIPFTLGLILPYIAYRQVRFVADHTVYGQTGSLHEGQAKYFWGIYLLALAVLLMPVALIAASVLAANTAGVVSGGILLYAAMPLAGAMVMARSTNLFYNHTTLGPVTFRSTQRARDMLWLYFSNMVMMAVTLGLFYPWAKVRLARYRASQLLVESTEGLNQFIAGQQQDMSATGSEMAELFDVEVGLV